MNGDSDPTKYFGGTPDSARGRIFYGIQQALLKDQRATELVHDIPDLWDPVMIEQIRAGTTPANVTSQTILDLLGLLQINVETVLSIWPPLTEEARDALYDEMEATNFRAIARADGCQSSKSPEQRNYEAELYLRLNTLKVLFDS